MGETPEQLQDEIDFLKQEIERVKALQEQLSPAEYRAKIDENHERINEIDQILAGLGEEDLEEENDLLNERDSLLNEGPGGLDSLDEEIVEREEKLKKLG
ncbi:hypothetical protein U0039_10160 [Stenotrophomonas maltophilia]|uniref:hypothetical protein n=1 Tax=Stenotrophomonas maltophilia TaxID=40324 RepID=UPI00046A8263|nr:hypothetical protein [Stenotrophomonas maltophilia]OMP41101.1 hypothetical protein BMR86_03300 [Stenotrophomonas sp. KAs 5-3]AIL08104.1 hypothetical protein DP16_1980 [Stenotrophomonas maltophilia]OOD14779.1 hypothetical protein BWP19_10625 [Stenotrophomonas maltophilia]QQA84467.1 hypothetical protein I6I01_08760 [Stenotrophomonas maltophilia]WQE25687.1 hypothetical protein U0039_10160 [Stenotrophomonas maltophilia]